MESGKSWTGKKKAVVIGVAVFAVLLLVYLIGVATGNTKPAVQDEPDESSYTTAETAENGTSAPEEPAADTTAAKTTVSQAATDAPTTRAPMITQAPVTTKAPSTTAAPTEPQNAIRLLSITSPVGRNETATLRIQGAPNTKYSISVFYSTAASEAAGLEDKVSGGDGIVEWSWKIGGRTNAGEHRVVISGGGESFETSIVTTEG